MATAYRRAMAFAKDEGGVRRARVPELPGGLPGLPPFLQHFDVRFCGPTMPFSGAREPRVAAWIRLREPDPIDGPLAAMLLDVLPPAITATFEGQRALASVDFTTQLFTRPAALALDPAAHLLVTIASRWAADGYTEEVRDLWSPEGVLIGQCRQLLALL